MIRRVEGLKAGIGLDQSEQLNALNASVSQAVRDPNGAVAQALKLRGYDLAPGVDAVSRRLGESEIKEIVGEYVKQTGQGNAFPEAMVSGNSSLVSKQTAIPLETIAPSDGMAMNTIGGGILA